VSGDAEGAAVPEVSRELRLHGSLDRVDPDGTIEGWCWSPDEPQTHRPINVFVDAKLVGQLLADQARNDLLAAGVGDGRHGFFGRIEADRLIPGAAAVVTLCDQRSGQQLGPPVEVIWQQRQPEPPPPPAPAPALLAGTLDRVSRDGWVSGWCWYPERPDEHVALSVLVDDVAVGSVRADAFRQDLQQAGIGDGTHGFSYALPYRALADKGRLTVTVLERGTDRRLGDPITMRIGRLSAAEERIEALERELRLLRGRLEELQAAADARADERAARALFGTVAAFFSDLASGVVTADGTGFGVAGLAATLREVTSCHAPVLLAQPTQPLATVCVPATAGFDMLYGCLAALHAAGVDTAAEIVVVDDGGQGAAAALLPTLVRNVRYVFLVGGETLAAGCNALAETARGETLVFLAPQARLAPGWLAEIAGTLAREPGAVAAAGRVLRADGLLEATGLTFAADGALRDSGHLAEADRPEHSFLRRVDALAAHAVAVRRGAFLEAGGFSSLYTRTGHAMVDLTARLAARGGGVLYQPLAVATWQAGSGADDAAAPDLSVPEEETLRLRERLRGLPRAAESAGHALVVDDDLPRPDRDAGSIATFEQMLVLRRLGWRVSIAAVGDGQPPQDVRDRLARHGIEFVGPPHFGSVTAYLTSEGADLDLLHIYRYDNAAMLLERARMLAPRAKVVFQPADLHFLREQRRAALAGQGTSEAMRAAELACVRAADATVLHSDYEYDVLAREVDPERLVLLRWIMRPEPPQTKFSERHDIGFVGNFRHPPNIDGVQWFAAEVLPLVRAALPNVRLHLAGSGMPQSIRDLQSDAVEVLGWVPDLAALFGRLRLSVAPLRYGAGFKGKVASSLGHGLPVVGSTISLEGTGLFDGDGVLAADDPAAFADAVVRLHEDAALWQRQSARAVERVATLYSPEAAEDVWRQLLLRLHLHAA
jgi:glycosyltransferase involved in cell wall biosynthesis